MNIKDITEKEITEFFLKDPALCYLGLPDNDLNNLFYEKKYIKHNISIYKGIYENENLISVLCYEYFTEFALNVHFYISTKLQKQSQATKIKREIVKYFKKKYPEVIKIIVMAPEPCKHVQAITEHYGFIKEGQLSKCIKWRNEFVDLLIYAKKIEEI